MPDEPSAPLPTPTNYQRTAGGHLQWQPPTPEHLQEMLPAYEVLSVLGQGGMGAVYKGRQKSLDRVVAIKILPPEAAEDDMQFAERFKNEARTMAKMNNASIVHVYDFGETTEGQLYIVMEFIDGTDVAKMIQSQGKLPEDYALSITAHVCDALGYAHEQGVVHRDIKPANVLINMQGQVKVADFGLAKATDPSQMGLTKTNMAMGTPDFVSPEALMPGVPLDGRADLYAVGVMLYNMLTGTIPRGAFRMPSATLNTDARFDQIIGKAMEMDRERRYQTALDLRRDLDVILTTPAAKSGMQTIPAQAALPQKPMGKSPGAPQQRSADAPIRKEPAAKPARAPVQAPKKSNAGMIYGIAAAVAVIAVAIFLFSGVEKKPAAAAKAVAETKPEPKKPETKPATPPPSKPTPKPAESKPAPTPAAVPAGNEKWVDGLAQWFGGTKTNDDFVRENNGGARIGGTARSLQPIPSSATGFRDQVARVRWRGANSTADLRLYVRLTKDASGKEVSYSVAIRPARETGWAVRILGAKGGSEVLGSRDWGLPSDFKLDAPHTMELRIIGDLLTATVDGKKIAEARDSTLTAGRPAISGHDMVIESFEYANLDAAGAAPASPITSTAKPGDILTFAGHRYQFHAGPFIKDEARDLASSLGGHLVTITSAAEQAWIEATFAKLIGGAKKDGLCLTGGAQGCEKWSNGEPWGYTNWKADISKAKSDFLALSQNGGKCPWQPTFWTQPISAIVEWDDDDTAKPAAIAATAHLDKPVDLLALVDVKRDTVKGEWAVAAGAVVSKASGGAAILEFAHTPPAEYDFEIEFTIMTIVGGAREVSQVLPVPGGNVMWIVGAFGGDMPLFCFGPCLDGKEPNNRSEASVKRARLKDGQRYRSLVEVRKDSLRALIDGEEVLKWFGDFQRFGGNPVWSVRNASFLGLGAFKSEVTFHKAELRPPGVSPSPASNAVATTTTPASTAPAPSAAPAVAPEDPRLAQLAAGFKARHEADALQPFNTALAALNTSYLANGVSRARTAAKAKGSLAEVTALDAEKTAIEQGRGVPDEDEADTPESLKALRGTYRSAHAKFAAERDAKAAPLYDMYVKALDAYIAELTQADKIDTARKVQVFRDDIDLRKPRADTAAPPATAKGTTSAPAPSAAAKPATRAPKMSEQEVAEWAIAAGGSVDVSFGTPPVRRWIAVASELPRGRFSIIEMHVNCAKVPGNDMSPLASAQDVGRLHLDNSPPDNTFLDLTPLRQMTALRDVRCGSDQDAAAVDVIASLSELTSLTIGKMPEGSFEKIGRMKNLGFLESPSITGPGLAALKGCQKLLKLTNRGNPNPVTDDDVRALVTALPELEELSLGNAKNGPAPITNACVPSLLALKSLKRLGLNGKGIDDSVLETVAKLRTLEALGLEATQITGSGFKALTKLVLLKDLFLIRTPITDAALDEIAKLKTLKTLYLQETTVSEAAVAKLQAALPDCKITTK